MRKSQETRYLQTTRLLAAILGIATMSVPALAHEDRAQPFTMGVIIGQAEGSKVRAGKYEQAIERITRSGRRVPTRFADNVNLCVAYTKTHDLEKASESCEAAIAEVKGQENRVSRIKSDRNHEVLAYRADLALALSNRGVLRAATGDTKRARMDFLAAIKLQTRNSWIFENNLDRVEQETPS